MEVSRSMRKRIEAMRTDDDEDAKLGKGLLLALAVILLTAVLGFHVTGPVNKLAVMANAPAVAQQQ